MSPVRIQAQDVMAAARQQGIVNRAKVRYAIVERNGSVSVLPQEDED